MANVIACYIRLSAADEDTGTDKSESSSITNQRALLQNYIHTHQEFEGWDVMEFADDGFSGTNDSRPEFQRMLTLAREGAIQCIIVKDFSRFARNYIIVGEYLEQIFPFLGIRFISVGDNYDSLTSTSMADSISMEIKSVLHAYYSKELSHKIKSTFEMKMKNGITIGPAPFGYKKNADKSQFLIDPEAAEIIRTIFSMAVKGNSLLQIADALNEAGCPTPAQYNLLHNNKISGLVISEDRLIWTADSVRNTIRNPVYKGTLTLKTTSIPYAGATKRRKTEPSEQYVFENAHEAIVSEEDFELAQKLITHTNHVSRNWVRKEYALKKHIRCGNCKHQMKRTRSHTPSFYCDYRNLAGSRCPQKSVRENEIENAVVQALQPMLQMLQHISKQHGGEQAQIKKLLADCQREIYCTQKQLSQNQSAKLELYEQYTRGELPLNAYRKEKDRINRQTESLSASLSVLQEREAMLRNGLLPQEMEKLTASAEKYRDLSVLTPDIVAAFIDQVEVYDTHIRINWLFQDVWKQLLEMYGGEGDVSPTIPLIGLADSSREGDTDGEQTNKC